MSISDEKLVDFGNQLMCLVSQKTQMPLCAITARFVVDGEEKRVVLSLGLKDHLGNVWNQNGRGSLKDARHHHLNKTRLQHFEEKYKQRGVFDVVYTSIDELQKIQLIDAKILNDPRNFTHQFCEFYIQQHTPPQYDNLSVVHKHFRTYLQGQCGLYAIALSDIIQKPICTIQMGNAVHYAVRHDDGDVEDIWGKRSVSNVVTDLIENPSSNVTVESVDAGSIALLKIVEFAEINHAKTVVKSNPRHQFNTPVQLSQPTL